MRALDGVGRRLFYVDLRSLAALRICLGLLIIGDIASRALHFEAHYSDLGIAPREVVLQASGWPVYCSLHWWLAGSMIGEAAVFVAASLCGLGLALGWRTRIMTIACWYLQASLMVRMPLISTAGDRTLQLMLFWLILLPAGARWSLDARRRPDRVRGSDAYVSLAAFGALIQVCFIYWFSVMLKLDTPMWRDGTAVQFALSVDAFATGFAKWLLQFEALLPLMTLSVMAWEFLGPCLPFIPGFQTPGRILAIIGFWLLHLGFALALKLGIFAWISCAAWVIFVPSAVWDRLLPHSDSGARSPLPTPRWQTAAAAVALVLVVLLNLRSLPPIKRFVPTPVAKIGHMLRMRQNWAMFTHEKSRGGWLVVQGQLADGREVDLLPGAGGPVTWEEPEVASRKYSTARWSQALHLHRRLETSPYWEPYSRYLCRTWNETREGEPRLERVVIWIMSRKLDLLGNETVVPLQLHDHVCTSSVQR